LRLPLAELAAGSCRYGMGVSNDRILQLLSQGKLKSVRDSLYYFVERYQVGDAGELSDGKQARARGVARNVLLSNLRQWSGRGEQLLEELSREHLVALLTEKLWLNIGISDEELEKLASADLEQLKGVVGLLAWRDMESCSALLFHDALADKRADLLEGASGGVQNYEEWLRLLTQKCSADERQKILETVVRVWSFKHPLEALNWVELNVKEGQDSLIQSFSQLVFLSRRVIRLFLSDC